MKTILFLGIIILIAALYFRNKPATQTEQLPDQDRLVLEQLKNAGSNLIKEHEIEFFIYLPTEKHAELVKDELILRGYNAKTKPAAIGTDWLCLVTRIMIPEYSEIIKIREEFAALANENGGEYDGWETQIIK